MDKRTEMSRNLLGTQWHSARHGTPIHLLRRAHQAVISVAAAVLLSAMGCGSGSPDTEIGTLSGSPLDQLPPGFTQITDFGLRASWSPDGREILFLDGLARDVWAYDLPTVSLRNLT